MYRHLLIIYILTSSLLSFADASPKFSDEVKITLYSQHRPFSKVDSICALVFHSWGTDTAKLHYSTEDFHEGSTLRKENGSYLLHTHNSLQSFKVIIFVRGQRFESDSLQRFPGNVIFWLEKDIGVNNSKLVDWSPFLHEHWYKYLTSLFVTLLVEILIGLAFYFKSKTNNTLKNYLITFVTLNLITHFSLWLIYSNAYVPLFFLELLVVAFECLYWKFYLKFSTTKAILISLLTNFASWTIGGILTFFM